MRPIRLVLLAALLSPTMAPAAFALDISAIKPHMEVKGMNGKHVGTVDKIEGDQMVLTKDDPAAGGIHHRLPVTAVDNISQNAVMLKTSAENAMAIWVPIEKPANDKPKN